MIARLGRRGFVGGAAAVSAALWLPRTVQAAQAMGFDDARHLLWRTSFGATPAEIEALASIDYATAVDRLLTKTHPQALTAAPAWVNEGPASLRQRQQQANNARKAEGAQVQGARPVQEEGRELRVWWVEEMLATDQPLIEKMTLFWHNHFTSSMAKVRYVPSLYWQNVLFRREALGNFATLLKAVARDPAMLIYLDGVRSVARQPNENFGRELLELFTLGEGHYSEADIKNAARAFTGWSIDRDTGHFVDHLQQHDGGEKTFLGQSPFDPPNVKGWPRPAIMRTSPVFSGTGSPNTCTVPTINSTGDLISAPRLAGSRKAGESSSARMSGFIS